MKEEAHNALPREKRMLFHKTDIDLWEIVACILQLYLSVRCLMLCTIDLPNDTVHRQKMWW